MACVRPFELPTSGYDTDPRRTFAYMGAEENVSSVVAFLPSILKGFGYTSTSAQWHSIPIYSVAFVLTLTCAYASERLHQRYLFAMSGALLNLIGLCILLGQPHAEGARYAGAFLLTAGCYIVMPIVVVWNAINVGPGEEHRHRRQILVKTLTDKMRRLQARRILRHVHSGWKLRRSDLFERLSLA